MRAAGHDVHFATAGDFVPRLRALGFPTHDVGRTIEQGIDQMMRSDPADGMPTSDDGRPDLVCGAILFLDILGRRTAADLVPVLQDVAPDMVVYEQYEFGAAIAAHALGIPAICLATPRGAGSVRRPKEWVVLTPPGDLDDWRRLTSAARRYVASLTGDPSPR